MCKICITKRKVPKTILYRRPSVYKFVELMNTNNRRELHRLMVFLKVLFKLYMDNNNYDRFMM